LATPPPSRPSQWQRNAAQLAACATRRSPSPLMSDLLRQLQSTAASASDEIAQLWLALWAHPHGLAVDRILQNLQLAISEHFNVIKAAGQPEDAQLLSWLRAIKAIQPVLREFEGDAMNGITRKARTPKSHPLARHGLIAHGIYAGCWNQHEGLPVLHCAACNCTAYAHKRRWHPV